MEPRIAKLLGDSLHDRTTLDPISLLPPPSVAPLRPHPVEPPPVGDEARANATPRRSDYVGNDHFGSKRSPVSTPSNRQKSSVSIAEVLNKENPTSTPPQPLPTLPTASTTPFSGRLSDILLDPSQEFPNKRRKVDEHNAQPALAGGENALLKLPKLPQLPKKTTKRPRIPPLLQGLHQPPPLPEKLFPPITGEGSGFGRDIGERVGLANAAGLPRGKETDIEIVVETGAMIANHDVNPRKGKEKEVEVEKEKDDPPVVGEPSAAALGDKYEQDLPEKEHRAPEEVGKVKETRKRNKWTEQETKDLLVGVSRFGIGNWKKILQCPEFTFNGRTAVDLKDRFRTCCPGEGLKVRKPKAKGNALDAEPQNPNDSFNSTHEQDGSSQEVVPNDGATSKQRKPRGDIHRKGPAELAKMGIQGPFVKSKRRERREFTEKDDENLLKGFEKYGAVWHSMRDDQELGFSMRHPTDLRDRFRIRYPEKYAKAGYKLKPKDEQMLRDKEKETTVTQETIAAPGGSHISDIPKDKEKERENAEEMASAETLVTVPSMVTSSTSNLRAHALLQPLLNSFPTPLEEVVDLASEDGDAAQSPIILNRNIFQWADANPSQLTSSTTIPNVGNLTSDISLNLFTGMEDVNSLAAIQLPLASVTSLPSYAQTSNPLTLSLPVNPTLSSNAQILNGPSNSSNAPTHAAISSAKASANSLLRTPNLPTIVFPHVPAASARSAVHNLPPPADLLSGLDLDPRTESQAGSFFIDDSLGFTLPSGASGLASTSTLAPLIGNNSGAGNAGRGILGAERGLLDDSLGLGMSERR